MELTQFVEDVKLLAHLSEEERSKVGPRRRRRAVHCPMRSRSGGRRWLTRSEPKPSRTASSSFARSVGRSAGRPGPYSRRLPAWALLCYL